MSKLLSIGGWSWGVLPTDASSPTNMISCSDTELSASDGSGRGTYDLLPTEVLPSKEEEEEKMSALQTAWSARIHPTLMRIMRSPPKTRRCKFRGPGSSGDIGYHMILLLPRQQRNSRWLRRG
jgi:hypothetical protein